MSTSRSIAWLAVTMLSLASVGAQAPPRLTAEKLASLKTSSNDPSGDFFADTPETLRTLIDAFVADTSMVGPMYLLMASNTALRLGRVGDAAFLFYAGQIRAKFDFERYDVSSKADGNNAATYLGFLMHTSGQSINPAIQGQPKQFAAVIQRIEGWEVVPSPNAFYPELTEAKGFKVPRAEWAALAQSVKTEFLEAFGRRYATLLNTPEYFTAFKTVQDVNFSPTEPDAAARKRVEEALEQMAAIEKRLFPDTPEPQKPTLTVTPGDLEAADVERDAPLVPASTSDVPVRVGGTIPAPTKITHVVPRFPAGIRGSIIVELTIDREGHVEIINVLRGDASLLTAVDEAVRQWRFEPLVVDGRRVKVLLPVSFTAR